MEKGQGDLGAQADPRPAGFWVRAVAAAVDLLVTGVPLALGEWCLITLAPLTGVELWRWVGWLLFLGATAYKPVSEWVFGATLGKAALGIRVRDESGGRGSLPQAVARNIIWMLVVASCALPRTLLFGFSFPPPTFAVNWVVAIIYFRYAIVPIFWIDGVSICLNRKKRAWHDLIAMTQCIRTGQAVQAPPEKGPGMLGAAKERFGLLVKTVGFYGERSTRFLDLWGYLGASEDRDGQRVAAPIGGSEPLAYDALDRGRTVVLWFPGHVVEGPPRPVGLRFRRDSDTVEAVHAPDGETWLPMEGAEWRLSKPFYYEFSDAALEGGVGLGEG